MSPDADSAGQPFAGRSFQPHPFAGDTGDADPNLTRALDAFHAVASELPDQRPYEQVGLAWEAVIEALRHARVLSPLIAEAGDFGLTDQGKVVEKTQELSVIHVEGPDGRPVAPLFSDVASMAAWRQDARPVPVDSARAAVAAAADGLAVVVVNPGSDSQVCLRRGAIESLARGSAYIAPWRDPAIASALEEGLQPYSALIPQHRVISGDPRQQLSGPEIVVVLGVVPGLDASELEKTLAAVSLAWSENDLLSSRVDGLGIKVIPA